MNLRSLFITFACIFLISVGCVEDTKAQSAEVKVNVLAGALTIFNPSLEVGFGSNSALSFEYVGSFAKESFLGTGEPLMLSMGMFEYRYYLKKSCHNGFFIGGDMGLFNFRMSKNIVPTVRHDHGDGSYDVGQGMLFGATLGYKYHFAKRWGVEASLSGGWQRSQHEGYDSDGVRMYELNPSAEWMLYKAGIYLSYRLWE